MKYSIIIYEIIVLSRGIENIAGNRSDKNNISYHDMRLVARTHLK